MKERKISDDVIINKRKRTIRVQNNIHSLIELYEYLADKFENAELPLLAATRGGPFYLQSGWKITSDSVPHLKGRGALVDGISHIEGKKWGHVDEKEVWANIWTLGFLHDDVVIHIEQGNKKWISPKVGHVDVLFKVKENGVEINDMKLTVYAMRGQEICDSFVTVACHAQYTCAIPLDTVHKRHSLKDVCALCQNKDRCKDRDGNKNEGET